MLMYWCHSHLEFYDTNATKNQMTCQPSSNAQCCLLFWRSALFVKSSPTTRTTYILATNILYRETHVGRCCRRRCRRKYNQIGCHRFLESTNSVFAVVMCSRSSSACGHLIRMQNKIILTFSMQQFCQDFSSRGPCKLYHKHLPIS